LSQKEFRQMPTRKTFFDIYEPEWTCPYEERIGPHLVNIGDGPKFLCAPHMLKSGLVYSIGSANQFSFERGIRRFCFNCKIHTFDGTVGNPKVPTALRGLSFHSWNIASEPSNGSKVISKSPKETLAEVHGTPNVTLEVLKMDCEGCEFEVLPRLLELAPSNQVLVEIHRKKSFAALRGLLRLMRSHGYLIFHKERNSWGCSGHSCVEYAFISIAHAYRVFRKELCGKAFTTAADE
jgi:hypothetical protein